MKKGAAFIVLMLVMVVPVYGQQTRREPPAKVIDLTLHAAAATRPALQYRLLPEVVDQRPGNGAPLYLTASRIGPDPKAADDLTGKLGDLYRDMPLRQMASSDFLKSIEPFGERMEVLDLAARREEARWETTLREQGAGAKLTYLSDLRINARVLSLKARWQIARHDWAGAAHTMQTGMSMARQMNDHALLINGLIEVGIADLLLDRVIEWGGEPGSPNLYWALSDLPTSFVDLHAISQWERGTIYFTFPQLVGVEPEQVSAEGWKEVFATINRTAGWNGEKPLGAQQLALLLASTYPKAKEFLRARGVPAARIEAMSVDQVVGSYFFREYLIAADEAWKGWQLPYWQSAGRGDANTTAAWDRRRQRNTENPIMAFIPMTPNARLQFARLDRKICVLQILESLRDYAATHQFLFPRSLEELKDLPAPLDPVTGKAFGYSSDGATAALEVVADVPTVPSTGTTYRLTIVH